MSRDKNATSGCLMVVGSMNRECLLHLFGCASVCEVRYVWGAKMSCGMKGINVGIWCATHFLKCPSKIILRQRNRWVWGVHVSKNIPFFLENVSSNPQSYSTRKNCCSLHSVAFELMSNKYGYASLEVGIEEMFFSESSCCRRTSLVHRTYLSKIV